MTAKSYLVTGNNLFNQWPCRQPVLESFKMLSEAQNDISGGFPIEQANLIKIGWSYNVFKFKDGFYITGAWGECDNQVIKLDILENLTTNSGSDLFFVGNDFNLYVVDGEKLKIWTLNIGETQKVSPLELIFDCPLIDQSQNPKISKVIASNKTIMFLTKSGHLFHGIPPVFVNTSHCIGKVCDIAYGYDHFILLTTAGYVYTWGCGRKLQLGHGGISSLTTPTEVKALAGLKITKIAAGGFHSLALSEFGDVYAWGWNKDGQLGVMPETDHDTNEELVSCSLPKLVDIYDDKGYKVDLNIIDMACGSRHSMLQLEDHTVWGTGFNKYGQLGLCSKNYPTVKYFRKVLDMDFDSKLVCGIWTSALVKEN